MTYRISRTAAYDGTAVVLEAITPNRLELWQPTGEGQRFGYLYEGDILAELAPADLIERIQMFAGIVLSAVERVTVYRYVTQLRAWAYALASGRDPRPFVDFKL